MKLSDFYRDKFLLLTSACSFILALLYTVKGIKDGFTLDNYFLVGANALYTVLSLAIGRRAFIGFNFFYSAVMLFSIGFFETYLYNNFTALIFILLIVITRPRLKWIALGFYLALVCFVFSVNTETVHHFLIHVVRTVWIFGIFNFLITNRFYRKKLHLTDDEKYILSELKKGKQQKEIDRFSKNTITKKLKDARERNKISSNYELLAQFSNHFTHSEQKTASEQQ